MTAKTRMPTDGKARAVAEELQGDDMKSGPERNEYSPYVFDALLFYPTLTDPVM